MAGSLATLPHDSAYRRYAFECPIHEPCSGWSFQLHMPLRLWCFVLHVGFFRFGSRLQTQANVAAVGLPATHSCQGFELATIIALRNWIVGFFVPRLCVPLWLEPELCRSTVTQANSFAQSQETPTSGAIQMMFHFRFVQWLRCCVASTPIARDGRTRQALLLVAVSGRLLCHGRRTCSMAAYAEPLRDWTATVGLPRY